jgi:hypothetical protein
MVKKRIFFQKTNHELLHSAGLTSVDMHFHSCYSDCYTQIPNIIKKATKQKIGVAITDHNAIGGALKAYNNNKGVMVIPGIEVSCKEGPHILLYFYNIKELEEFYNKHIKKNLSLNPYWATSLKVSDLLEKTKGYNCIRCAAHPYGYSIAVSGLSKSVNKHRVDETVFDNIDSMEVICGVMNRVLNRRAEKKANLLGKSITGGTDGHTLFELGHVVTSSHANDVDSFLDNIKKNKNLVVGRETNIIPKIIPGTNMIRKHMKYAIPSLKMRLAINMAKLGKVPGGIVKRTVGIKKKISKISQRK